MIEVTAERRVYPRPTLPTSVTIPNSRPSNNSSASENSAKTTSEKSPKISQSSSISQESQKNTSPTKGKSLMEEIAVRSHFFLCLDQPSGIATSKNELFDPTTQ